MSMNHIFVHFNNLNQSTINYGFIYIGFVLLYNCYEIYNNSVLYLNKYRNKELTSHEKTEIHDDWTAVKYGSQQNLFQNLWNSIIFPITIASNIIPYIVLLLNKQIKPTQSNIKYNCN